MSQRVRVLLHLGEDGAFTLSSRAAPDELAATVARFRSADVVLDGDGLHRSADEVLVYDLAAASPLDPDVLQRPHDLLMVFAYHVPDEAAMLAFDARITEEYTRFYAQRGVLYTGVYRVDGGALGGGRLGEVLAWDGVASVEEAERLGSEDLPQRIVDIEDECRALQDREASRFVLWLQPKA